MGGVELGIWGGVSVGVGRVGVGVGRVGVWKKDAHTPSPRERVQGIVCTS